MEEQNQAPVSEKKSHKKILPFFISAVIIIVLVSFGGIFLINNINKDVPDTVQNIADEDMSELMGEPTRSPSLEVKYSCVDNKSIEVAIYNEGDKPSANLVMSDGSSVFLYQVESDSGARYANSDESMVFWTNGNEAFVEENGKQTYSDCVESS